MTETELFMKVRDILSTSTVARTSIFKKLDKYVEAEDLPKFELLLRMVSKQTSVSAIQHYDKMLDDEALRSVIEDDINLPIINSLKETENKDTTVLNLLNLIDLNKATSYNSSHLKLLVRHTCIKAINQHVFQHGKEEAIDLIDNILAIFKMIEDDHNMETLTGLINKNRNEYSSLNTLSNAFHNRVRHVKLSNKQLKEQLIRFHTNRNLKITRHQFDSYLISATYNYKEDDLFEMVTSYTLQLETAIQQEICKANDMMEFEVLDISCKEATKLFGHRTNVMYKQFAKLYATNKNVKLSDTFKVNHSANVNDLTLQIIFHMITKDATSWSGSINSSSSIDVSNHYEDGLMIKGTDSFVSTSKVINAVSKFSKDDIEQLDYRLIKFRGLITPLELFLYFHVISNSTKQAVKSYSTYVYKHGISYAKSVRFVMSDNILNKNSKLLKDKGLYDVLAKSLYDVDPYKDKALLKNIAPSKYYTVIKGIESGTIDDSVYWKTRIANESNSQLNSILTSSKSLYS